jgi:uncharacterized membrane protein
LERHESVSRHHGAAYILKRTKSDDIRFDQKICAHPSSITKQGPRVNDSDIPNRKREFAAAEIGALAHLYRGEIYRSTIWRTRLDTTTNWSVVTLGVALSISFSSPEASPLPLLLAGVLVILFMTLEARRYRYFNVWRARARWLETHFYAPLLLDGDLHTEENWQETLAHDYWKPEYHVGYLTAIGRRVRRNYLWILGSGPINLVTVIPSA